MYIFELCGTEAHPTYQSLAISNADRQFQFLEAIIDTAQMSGHRFMSHAILKALNFHAIACLHSHAGEYRPCEVRVEDEEGKVQMEGLAQFRVQAGMDQFVNHSNSLWNVVDHIALAAYVLWQICRIHPFVNGNGRTARAACYYVLCVRMGGRLPGTTFLPTLLKGSPEYIPALRAVDASAKAGVLDLAPLQKLITDLLAVQLASSPPVAAEALVPAPDEP